MNKIVRYLAGFLGLLVTLSAQAATPILSRPADLPTFPLPVAYWSFDRCDGGIVLDDRNTDDATDASLIDGASCTSFSGGRFGPAGSFDGIDDRAEIPNNARLNFTGNALSISAWVRPDAVQGGTIVNKWYAMDSYMLALQNGQYAFTVAFPGGTWGTTVDVYAPATPGVWTHVAGVWDGTTSRIYLNGVLQDSAPASGTLQQSTRPVVIGSHPGWASFDGLIDEVRLYNVALSSAQVTGLAAPPEIGNRGLHLYASQWAPNPYGAEHPYHVRDLSLLQYTGNLNSVKTTIFTYINLDPYWIDYQNTKLTEIKATVGNHVTYVFRAWPVIGIDMTPNSGNAYQEGWDFAQNLAPVLAHMHDELKLIREHVVIEVANEPNISCEGFVDATGFPDPHVYNDFFRGFFYGQAAAGYDYPLAYAGLSPGSEINDEYCPGKGQDPLLRYDSDAWYQDFWVQNHIANYADKIAAHVYWTQGVRNSLTDGKYYRRIHQILSPNISPRGIVITEFNGLRSTFDGASTEEKAANQIADVCEWWRELAADAAAGYWVEQSQLFVTHADDSGHVTDFKVLDSQIDEIRECQEHFTRD